MRRLIDRQDDFLTESRDVLGAGLQTATWVTVDDTGGRNAGRNGSWTQIGSDGFTWFGTRASKSRHNFLNLLRTGQHPRRHSGVVLQCLALVAGHLREGPAHLSSGDLKQSGDERRLSPDVAATDVPNLPLPHHCHRLLARQCASGRPEATEAQAWASQLFHVPVILLHDIVQIFHLSQP
jgi:hypothetical protein